MGASPNTYSNSSGTNELDPKDKEMFLKEWDLDDGEMTDLEILMAIKNGQLRGQRIVAIALGTVVGLAEHLAVVQSCRAALSELKAPGPKVRLSRDAAGRSLIFPVPESFEHLCTG